MKIKAIFLSAILAVTSLTAQETRSLKETTNGYNAPANVDVNGYNIFMNASFIYWQPKEGELELGQYDPINDNLDYYETINMSLDYHPGFKVSFGFNYDYDNWDIVGNYLRYHSTDKKGYSPPNWAVDINDFWTTTTNSAHMDSKLKVHLDLVSLILGRYFYVGKKLILRPNIGLQGGIINQRLYITSVDYTYRWDVSSNYRSHSWCVGPYAGLDTSWILTQGFNVAGNVGFSLLYQDFHSRAKVQDNDVLTNYTNYKFNPSQITPNIDLNLGLGWGAYFLNNRCHFNILASYEFNYFFNQNLFRQLLSSLLYASKGDLMLHGLTLKVQVDF